MHVRERTKTDDAEDLTLLRRVAREDRLAFEDLYVRFHGRLFRFLYRFMKSHCNTEELINDVMLIVWRSATSFRGDSKASTWIFGIAYRQAMKSLGRQKKRLRLHAVDVQITDVDNTETENWIQLGLESLPEIQRNTTELVFYLGLSYQEVAEVMNCPVSTVKTRMFHARRKLKVILPGIA